MSKNLPWNFDINKGIAKAKRDFNKDEFEVTDAEALGKIVSLHLRHATEDIIETFNNALTDSNAHSLSYFIEEISKHALGDNSFNLKLGDPAMIDDLIIFIQKYPKKTPMSMMEARVARRVDEK